MRNADAQPIVRTLLEHHAARRPWRGAAAGDGGETGSPGAGLADGAGCVEAVDETIPAATYTSAEHLAAERDVLFRQRAQVVALSADLPQPGSVVARDRLGPPVVLTRGGDGAVNALVNVCAHRAAQVVPDGRSCERRLTCPYHAWSYDLDGTLKAVPDPGSFPSVAAPGPGMQRLPVREAHGLVWVVPDVAASSGPVSSAVPEPELGAIADDLDHYGIGEPGRWRQWRTHRFDLALNWKLVVDTFLEPYHFASLHRTTVGPLFVPNLCVAQGFGPHVREVLPRRSITELAEQPPDRWDVLPHSTIVYLLFPNTVFVYQVDHVETWRVYPDPVDPGRSVCDLDFYVPDLPPTEPSERHWERNWDLTIDTVIHEDFAAMAGVQRGLASGAFPVVRAGANEPALRLFHRALDEAVPSG